MTIILTAGVLAVVSLAVVVSVTVFVSISFFFILRSSSPSLHHCSRCHSGVYLDNVKVPPQYSPLISPFQCVPVPSNHQGTTNHQDGFAGCEEGKTGINTSLCNAKQSSHPTKSTRDLPFKTPDAVHLNHQTSIISDRQDQDFKFQRSCSTRKKSRRDKNYPNVSNLDAGSHSGKLFRSVLSQISPKNRDQKNISVKAHYNRSKDADQVRIDIEKKKEPINKYLHPLNDRESYHKLVRKISHDHDENKNVAEEKNSDYQESWGSTLPQYCENLI